jgi:hypothetical protein
MAAFPSASVFVTPTVFWTFATDSQYLKENKIKKGTFFP